MRNKLAAFSEFANSLFPHETDYLLSIQQFTKPENLKILNLVSYNSKNPLNRLPYDNSIDKRCYSYLKNWMEESLAKADVDKFYEWLLSIEKSVMSDTINPDEEAQLMQQAANTSPSRYYFMRFYQVMQLYRDYLLVRNRIRYYSQVTSYLQNYHYAYIRASNLNIEMNVAAESIVNQIASYQEEFIRWETLFKEIYYDLTLDGYTRYRAAVRLTILHYTNREFERLQGINEHLNQQFKTDLFYSKRILANYYHNCAMMHSKMRQLDIAEKYAYLSIRNKNSDFLFYLVSLCEILLKTGKKTEALKIMSESIPELKNTNSFHSRIGFVSYYIKTLVANSQIEKAISYGRTFLESFKKEIFEFRWHLFFSSYMQVLLKGEKYTRILTLSKRYKLVQKERQLMEKAVYLPVILWYTALSDYMELNIKKEKFFDIIIRSGKELIRNQYKATKIIDLLNDMANALPDEIKEISEKMGI
jgi:hypothetical protein